MSNKFIKIELPENISSEKGVLLCVSINEYLTNVWQMNNMLISLENKSIKLMGDKNESKYFEFN